MTTVNYQKIFDCFPIGIAIFDISKTYIYVNDCYCNITGNSREFYLGMTVNDLKTHGFLQDGQGVVDKVIRHKTIIYGTVPVIDITWENNYKLLSIGIPIMDEHNEIQHIVVVQEREHDLSKRLERSIWNTMASIHVGKNLSNTKNADIIAESEQMQNIFSLLDSVSPSDIPILLHGDSGTGKEVLATYIHQNSNRQNGPFIILNCGAIPESLIESELFGYEKGAFSGALTSGKTGLFEAAHTGTLFLDEINSMPLHIIKCFFNKFNTF